MRSNLKIAYWGGAIEDTKFDKIDCSQGTPQEIAKTVSNWLTENLGNGNPN